LDAKEESARIDPHYKLLIGRMFDRIGEDYPVHVQLPAASMPDEIVSHVVQHQFRKTEHGWPLVQLGPGVLTLNDTDGYVWSNFESRISRIVAALYEGYPSSTDILRPTALILRYIDAVEFEFDKENVFDFLSHMLKTTVRIDQKVFEATGVQQSPQNVDMSLTFQSDQPIGVAHIRIVRGSKNGNDALVWETQVQSGGKDTPKSVDTILAWVRQAHSLTHAWFFNMISGELLERFK